MCRRGDKIMSQQLGDVINQARRARRLTLRQLAEKVRKEDGQPISPQYLNDIELNRRVPSTYVLQELARELELTRICCSCWLGREQPSCASTLRSTLSKKRRSSNSSGQHKAGDSKIGSDCGRS